MEIHPQRATGEIDSNNIPQTYTEQVSTNVMIPNGETMVIGGLINSQVVKAWDGIPFLSRIPLLGYLFRHTNDQTVRTEMVIVITPHICRPERQTQPITSATRVRSGWLVV